MAVRTLTARVELDGEKQYKEALKELNTGNATLRTEMQKLQAEYKNQGESTEFLTKKSELLERQLLQQHDKVETLRQAVANAAKQYGESDAKTQKWIQQLNRAEAEEYNLKNQLEDTTKAMEGQDQEMVGLGDTVTELGEKFGIRLPAGIKDALNSIEGFSAGTVAALGAAAVAVAGLIEAFKKLGEITLQVAADADEYLSKSAITGVPTEMLQAWDYAAPLIDTDVETITGAMTKLTKAMGDAQGGSEATQAKFAELGISIEDSNGNLRSSEEVFMDVIDALGQMENSTERDAAAMALLGKGAQELNPLINAGTDALKEYSDEAKALGYVLDEEQIEKLGEVDDSYQRVKLTLEAIKKQMAADFAPAAKAAMDLFSDAVHKAGEWLKRSGLIENLASIIETLIDIFRTLGEFITSIPGLESGLDLIKNALKGVAIVLATIADTAKVVVGLMPWMWGSGMLKEGLGFGDEPSNLQKVTGTARVREAQRSGYVGNGGADMSRFGYDPATGQYFDPATGNYINPLDFNAAGNDNWRGGLTWVGEAGPELVALPGGSRILNAQDSRNLGGATFYITIDAKNVREFNDIVDMAMAAQAEQRMR